MNISNPLNTESPDPSLYPGDPAHDVFRGDKGSLDVFFRPKSVAVVGATEHAGTVGRTLLWNLISSSFGGTVYPVNPKRPSVLGIKAYPRLSAIPDAVDLVVIATPAPSVPDIIAECVSLGVPGAIIISAGFKESGAEGAALEKRVREIARGKMRILGPNCLGFMCPPSGLNATFAKGIAAKGNVGFLSQSGALCTAVLDWSFREKIGFSAFVSLGSMLDIGWGDLIDYLGNDPKTESIVIYMESVGDARSFMSAAREVSLSKPIIVIKAGRTDAAAKAAVSHTGSLVGRDDVLDAAFERCGVIRVDAISDLFQMAGVLARQPRPKGPRLTIVTNAGGPGVLAADSLIENGGHLANLSLETMKELNSFLPAPWSHGNPVDVLGDADAARYGHAFEAAAKDPNSDGLLLILTPQDMTDPTGSAQQLALKAGAMRGKPILASWMGGESVEAGRTILAGAGVPVFKYPDTAAKIFCTMHSYNSNLQSLYETPHLSVGGDAPVDRKSVDELIQTARSSGRTVMTEDESKRLLALYGIPTVETKLATTADEAVREADSLTYPIVLKLHSKTITHKSDVGGVFLNLGDAAAVRRAFDAIKKNVEALKGPGHFDGVTVQRMIRWDGYEVICGASPDPQFGPMLLFGTGGKLVEIYQDKALGLPPLTSTLARRMMAKTKIWKALQGVRGQKVSDLAALERVMIRFSWLVLEQTAVKEIDINPLLVSPEGVIAMDARVALYTPEEEKTRVRSAIRPYPSVYDKPAVTKDGTSVRFRPVRPEDEPLLVEYHAKVSDRSVVSRYMRSFELSERVAHERLRRVCFVDYDREMVIVAEQPGSNGKPACLWAVGRLSRSSSTLNAQWSMLVADPYQHRGVGTAFLKNMVDIARAEGVKTLWAEIRQENKDMLHISQRLGFRHTTCTDGTVRVTLSL
ncbi:MAG: bifunctional acetate--CoA ligase family protein/GNAT family N-acetyltransferase [Elusimicrobia bacterium]|nr:bifunctional acetate--CoA ligase family protein/GNAT family N-acetyltransferase [Elusimicrobiota bacterium]